MYQPSKISRAVSVLAITFASGFASAVVGGAQDHASENTSTAARQETNSPQSPVEILTPTDGVDFRPYLNVLVRDVRKKWYASMPEAALKGEKGEAVIRFQIESNGNAEGVVLETSSGKDVFDETAIQAIRDASPFQPLPATFKHPPITLRFVFYYNVRPPTGTTDAAAADCDAVPSATHAEGPFDRLEVLAFVSHNFDVTYAEKIICQRGIDFSPDAATLETFRIYNVQPALVATIGKLKPKTIDLPSPDRDRAYNSLTLALSDVRERATESRRCGLQARAPVSRRFSKSAFVICRLSSSDTEAVSGSRRTGTPVFGNLARRRGSIRGTRRGASLCGT
jgi:TonB family protein